MNLETGNANRTVDTLIRKTKSGECLWKEPEQSDYARAKSNLYGFSPLPNTINIGGVPLFRSVYCDVKQGRFFLEGDPYSSVLNIPYALYVRPKKDAQKTRIPADDGKISRLVNTIQDQMRARNQELEQFLDDFNAS